MSVGDKEAARPWTDRLKVKLGTRKAGEKTTVTIWTTKDEGSR